MILFKYRKRAVLTEHPTRQMTEQLEIAAAPAFRSLNLNIQLPQRHSGTPFLRALQHCLVSTFWGFCLLLWGHGGNKIPHAGKPPSVPKGLLFQPPPRQTFTYPSNQPDEIHSRFARPDHRSTNTPPLSVTFQRAPKHTYIYLTTNALLTSSATTSVAI